MPFGAKSKSAFEVVTISNPLVLRFAARPVVTFKVVTVVVVQPKL